MNRIKNKNLLCIGHRGAMGHEPENTLISFRKAIEIGAPAIEFDVHLVDGHLVVIHDSRLERTTDGTGQLTDHPFSYLRGLNAGKGQQVPTLEEVCLETAGKALLNIELKGAGTAEQVAHFISDINRAGWRKEMFLVSSFDHDELLKITLLDPEIRLGALYDNSKVDLSKFTPQPKAYSVHFPADHVDRNIIKEAHFHELKVFVYTVNDIKDIERMFQLGVDGVFTNYPDRVVNNYKQINPSQGWP